MTAPASTYRLQLHQGFTLHDATAAAPYLARLGVSHLYLSPILQSAPGSLHGYDGVDPTRIDCDRGGRDGLIRLLDVCASLNLGLVLDIVPNHLDVSSAANRWWASLLRLGRASPWAAMFDIDWESPHAPGRVILPVLGAPLDEELRAGAMGLGLLQGELCAQYHERAWPIRPASVADILLDASLARGPARARLRELGERFARIDEESAGQPNAAELEANLDDAAARLAALLSEDDSVKASLVDALGRASTRDALAPILDAQHYALMDWRQGAARVNYRRFFDINALAGLRVEDDRVFDAAHALIVELAALPGVDGLRVDHPDGLRDPKAYFDRLANRAPGAWVIAEKILELDEQLPEDWAVAGTTGYDFLNDALAVLADGGAAEALANLHEEITGSRQSFGDVALASKRLAARNLLRADLDRLTRLALAALPEPEATRWDVQAIADALAEIAARLPVYRTYFSNERGELCDADRARLSGAIERADDRRADVSRNALDAVGQLLLDPASSPTARELLMRFQQFTAPAAAKGVEDTALYRSSRFVAANEVGGDPSRLGMTVDTFHARVQARAAKWPDAMLATSTHDTKRSEDVRARLTVLTEAPDKWAMCPREWMETAQRIGRGRVDANAVYLLLQTIVGAWPIEIERVQRYMTKAAREAKLRSSWMDIDEAYERELAALIEGLYSDAAFMASLEAFVAVIRRPGRVKSLAQVALRLTCPGVPDTYQGCELWDLSLVDPDNRRPVDFALRAALLERLKKMSLEEVWASLDDAEDPGLSKLWLMRALLGLRRRRPDALNGRAAYVPLTLTGQHGGRAVAFGRGRSEGAPAFIAVVPLRAMQSLEDCQLEMPTAPCSAWTNLCTGRRVEPGMQSAASLLSSAPVALLVDEEALS